MRFIFMEMFTFTTTKRIQHMKTKEFMYRKKRVKESNKQKTKKQKRQDKINKLSSLDKHWKGLEHIDHSQLNEDIDGLNKVYMKLRSLYQPARKFSCKEWIEAMGELLDEID